MSTTPTSPIDVVRAFLSAMENKDYTTGLQFVADDCVYVNGPVATMHGPAGVRAMLEPFFAPTLENTFIIKREAVSGATVFMERLDRHRLPGGWAELPVTGVIEVHNGPQRENTMLGFRGLLVAMFGVLLVYSAVVIVNHGANLLPVFFGDMAAMAWPGQFNLDFMFMLTLSGLWVAWRHRFSAAGLALGLGAFFVGALFLSVYLLVVSVRAQGDMRVVMLGDNRASA